jgi:transcriptional regulator with XRE-family HTH domain
MFVRSNFIASHSNVNSRVKKVSGSERQQKSPSQFGERLLFVIWLAGKILGVENAKQFAEAIGKGQSQLSRWVKEDPRPEWTTIKRIADSVSVDPLWLDEPSRPGAVEPADFAQWLDARRTRTSPKSRKA